MWARPPSYVCWFRFAPVTSSLFAYYKPYWNWSCVNPNLAISWPGASLIVEITREIYRASKDLSGMIMMITMKIITNAHIYLYVQ